MHGGPAAVASLEVQALHPVRVIGLVQIAQRIALTEATTQERRAARVEGIAHADTPFPALSDRGVEAAREDLCGAVVDEGAPADDREVGQVRDDVDGDALGVARVEEDAAELGREVPLNNLRRSPDVSRRRRS